MDPHAERRRALLEAMGPGVAIIPAASTALRNNDVEHPYRQDSDHYYLTGLDEPDSVAVISAPSENGPNTSANTAKFTLFLRARHPERERWDGARIGIDGAKQTLGADEAFSIDELESKLPALLSGHRRLHYKLGRHRTMDDKVLRAIESARGRARNGGHWPVEIVDPAVTLHELRLRKSEVEIEKMRRAAEITELGHRAAMAAVRPEMHESEIESILSATFRKYGSDRHAYSPIVAGGKNATVLHYRGNNARLEANQLLLIDAGCEYDYYASDVSRTFPISGVFTPAQRELYQVVLDAQLAAIATCKPGETLDSVHEVAVRALIEGLIQLKLLPNDIDHVRKNNLHRRFYMHRTSHWLGMDVHDVGGYNLGMKPRPLEPRMVLTVEPGLYLGDEEDIPVELRNTGIRIEDDVMITEAGCTVLTNGIPKSIQDIEAICAR